MTTTLKTPVAFIVFNRPKCTRRVFERIREARPEKLYLIADAPRAHKPGEAAACAETRRIVESMIDWPCEVHKNYAEENMGCGKRIPSGLDWVFDHEEEAIIMEDDILASPSFFSFCEAMLDRYRNDGAIMQISGYNRLNYSPDSGNYFRSKYCDFWGWATWRTSWEKFHSIDAKKWESIKKDKILERLCECPEEARMRIHVMDDIMSGRLNAWGMRWDITRLIHQGQGIVPGKNLVKNIGFGPGASHTLNPLTRHQLMVAHPLREPFEPSPNLQESAYDRRYVKQIFSGGQQKRLRDLIFYLMGRS